MAAFSDLMLAIFFLSLRFVPLFTFAPPFTLMRIPVTIRVLLGISLALWMALSFPEQTSMRVQEHSTFALASSELAIGVTFALSLQWAFAAIYTIGRSLDVQAGFAMAMLADPANQSQLPLLGTVLGYGAAVVFFGIGGAADMLAIMVESVIRVPMGDANIFVNPGSLISFISVAFVAAVGLVGLVMLVLFMIDMTVAYLSRTLPQMNVLLIGFQVKTLAILAVTPIALSLSLAAYLRLVRGALNTTSMLVLGT
jgi:flagellar biosynthetic protein FliR